MAFSPFRSPEYPVRLPGLDVMLHPDPDAEDAPFGLGMTNSRIFEADMPWRFYDPANIQLDNGYWGLEQRPTIAPESHPEYGSPVERRAPPPVGANLPTIASAGDFNIEGMSANNTLRGEGGQQLGNPWPPADQVAAARAYLKATAVASSTSSRFGVDRAIDYLHPDFAVKAAAAVQTARAAGIPASPWSTYRAPMYKTSGYRGNALEGAYKSLHAYGLGIDFSGIGTAGSQTAKQFEQIAEAAGISNPYGYGNRKEFNHYQLTPVRGGATIAAQYPGFYELMREVTPKAGPENPEQMWRTYDAVMSLPDQVAALGGPEGVKAFQASHPGLEVDGIVGPQTARALIANAVSGAPPSAVAARPEDPETALAAGVVLAEARGEGDEGMKGVANVINNRVRDTNPANARWGDTVTSVLSGGEFAPPLTPDQVTPEEWQRAVDIVTATKRGWVEDNTGGALFFKTDAVNPKWASVEPYSTTIKNHQYYGKGTFADPAATAIANVNDPGTLDVTSPQATAATAPVAPVAPAATDDARAKPIPASITTSRPLPPAPKPFAPITEARTKDDFYTPPTPSPFSKTNVLDGIQVGPDWVKGPPVGPATAFAPIAGRDPLTGATKPYDLSGIRAGTPDQKSYTPFTRFSPEQVAGYDEWRSEPEVERQSVVQSVQPFASVPPTASTPAKPAVPRPISTADFVKMWTDPFKKTAPPVAAAPLTPTAFAPPPPVGTHIAEPKEFAEGAFPGIPPEEVGLRTLGANDLSSPDLGERVTDEGPTNTFTHYNPFQSLPPDAVSPPPPPPPQIQIPKPPLNPRVSVNRPASPAIDLRPGGLTGAGKGWMGLFGKFFGGGFNGPQQFTANGPSGTFGNGYNYQRGTGIQGENSTQFTRADGRTYTYTDQSQWGQPSIGGWN